MEDLDKSFDKKFTMKPVQHMFEKGIDASNEWNLKNNEPIKPKEVKAFIRQREKDLLDRVIATIDWAATNKSYRRPRIDFKEWLDKGDFVHNLILKIRRVKRELPNE